MPNPAGANSRAQRRPSLRCWRVPSVAARRITEPGHARHSPRVGGTPATASLRSASSPARIRQLDLAGEPRAPSPCQVRVRDPRSSYLERMNSQRAASSVVVGQHQGRSSARQHRLFAQRDTRASQRTRSPPGSVQRADAKPRPLAAPNRGFRPIPPSAIERSVADQIMQHQNSPSAPRPRDVASQMLTVVGAGGE